ncbi:MAG: lysophospholipase [Propionibacterium sp.]|nr:lysophospholipase [Propionibacterium sp.]
MELHTHLAATDHPLGTVLITHGYAEHSGRYAHVVSALTEGGWDVHTHDLPGHGTAPGPRARVDVGALILDHLRLRREALERSRTEGLFLLGHSMGATIAAASSLLEGDRLNGVVLTGPALRPDPSMPSSVAHSLLPMARMAPGTPTVHLDDARISRVADVVREYREDPLVYHGRVPLLTAVTLVVQGDRVIDNAAMLTVPTLILHGGADALAHVEGSREYVERTRTAEVHLRIIDGAYHEILNEPEGPALLQDIMMWMDARR